MAWAPPRCSRLILQKELVLSPLKHVRALLLRTDVGNRCTAHRLGFLEGIVAALQRVDYVEEFERLAECLTGSQSGGYLQDETGGAGDEGRGGRPDEFVADARPAAPMLVALGLRGSGLNGGDDIVDGEGDVMGVERAGIREAVVEVVENPVHVSSQLETEGVVLVEDGADVGDKIDQEDVCIGGEVTVGLVDEGREGSEHVHGRFGADLTGIRGPAIRPVEPDSEDAVDPDGIILSEDPAGSSGLVEAGDELVDAGQPSGGLEESGPVVVGNDSRDLVVADVPADGGVDFPFGSAVLAEQVVEQCGRVHTNDPSDSPVGQGVPISELSGYVIRLEKACTATEIADLEGLSPSFITDELHCRRVSDSRGLGPWRIHESTIKERRERMIAGAATSSGLEIHSLRSLHTH